MNNIHRFGHGTAAAFCFEGAAQTATVSAGDAGRGAVRKTQGLQAVSGSMDEQGRPSAGERVRTTVDGTTVSGTVESVTYTPKKGALIAAVSLDEPTPDGRTRLPVAVEDLDRR